MPRLTELNVQVVSIKFQSQEHDWIKLLIRYEGQTHTAVGSFDASELKLRHDYVMFGYWESHEKYGRQFRFTSMVISEPVSYQGVVVYLQQAKHLGAARAQKIWTHFQSKAVEIVRTHPETIASIVDVPVALAAEWADYFIERRYEEKFDQELMGLLAGHGFQYKRIKKALQEKWGMAAINKVQEDPFHMAIMQMPSAGFMRCDNLYIALGKNPHALRRQAFCAYHEVKTNSSGNTWFEEYKAELAINQRVGGTEVKPERALKFCRRAKLIERFEESPGKFLVCETEHAEWERRLAANIHRLGQGTPQWLNWLRGNKLDRLYDTQSPQVWEALRNHPLFLLVGPPGTGKSFVLSEIIRNLEGVGSLSLFTVCSLAGKAAVRCTNLLCEAGIPLRANTIHTTMGFDFHDGEYNFKHSRDNELDCKVLIVDEVSMVGTTLLSKLLDAAPDGCHVIFVGDHNQLEPVENGAPLRDMLAAGVPTVLLDKIERNAGTIVRACHSMIHKGPLLLDRELNIGIKPPQNLKLLECDGSEFGNKLIETYKKIMAIGRHDPIWDVQTVVAVNDNTPFSRKTTNILLQELLNPNGYRVEGNPFRVGDKIINLKNGVMESASNKDLKRYIANGEFGTVTKVEPRRSFAKFGDHELVLAHGKLIKDSDDDDDTKASVDLGYAVTVHKMQGSQAPVVLVALDDAYSAVGPKGVCNLAWLYTAISRAQDLCFLIGKHSTALRMMGKSNLSSRRTRLVEYLNAYKQEVQDVFSSIEG